MANAVAQDTGTNFVAKLTDESWLRVRRVEFGNNVLDLAKSGEVTRVNPEDLGKRFRPKSDLMVWCSVWPERESPRFKRWILSDAGQYFSQGSYTRVKKEKRIDHGTRFRVFPRRDKEFTFKGTIDDQPFAVRIPNPLYPLKEIAPLKFETPSDSEFEIKLNEIRIGESKYGPVPRSYASSSFSVLRDGRDFTHWFDIQSKFHDETGNSGSMLPLTEEYWKLRVAAFPGVNAKWNPVDYISIKPKKLPGPAEAKVFKIHRTLGGRRVDSLTIGGPGNFVISNDVH